MSGPDEDLVITRDVTVPAGELQWSYTTSGGPGGQHANRARTRVVLVFDLAGSPSIPPSMKARLRERLPAEVRLEVDEHRSQWQNRRVAHERLRERLIAGLSRPKARRATKPTKGSKRRRLDAKRRRSEVKRGRQRPQMGD